MILKPYISDSIYLKLVENEYRIYSNSIIRSNSIIEVCAWLPIKQKIAHIIQADQDSLLTKKIFENPDGIQHEQEVVSKIGELQLLDRLDKGLLSPEDLKNILLQLINPTTFMEINTHAILLGYGSLYRTSSIPNINWRYDEPSKLYVFFSVTDIYENQELTYYSN